MKKKIDVKGITWKEMCNFVQSMKKANDEQILAMLREVDREVENREKQLLSKNI